MFVAIGTDGCLHVHILGLPVEWQIVVRSLYDFSLVPKVKGFKLSGHAA